MPHIPSLSPAWYSMVFALAATLVSSPLAAAENGAGEYKIGVVNVKEVFDNYERQTRAYADLEKERNVAQAPIDELSEKITKLKERYDSESSQMSAAERSELEELIESEYSRYKAEFQRSQEEIDRKEKRLLEVIFAEIQTAVEEVGALENYHIILEGGQARSSLLYYSTTLNITQRVIEYLNSKQE